MSRRITAFRLLLALLGLIWAMPVPVLLSHRSAEGWLLGRYTPAYAALLLAYAAIPAAAGVAVWRGGSRLAAGLRWLRARPVVLALALYGLLEGWYALRSLLMRSRLFFDAAPAAIFGLIPTAGDLTILLIAAALLAATAGGVLLLGGLPPADRRRAVGRISISVGAGAAVFTALSLVYTLALHGDEYRRQHRFWFGLHRLDPLTGYSLRPGLRDYPILFGGVDREATVTTDARGFRSPDGGPGAPIAGVGDTALFGYGVEESELWSAHLSRLLGMEVASYGVSRYGLWQYNLVAERHLQDAGHRLVFYGLSATDIRDDTLLEANVRLLQRWELRPWQSPLHYTAAALLDRSPAAQLADWLTGPGPAASPADDLVDADGCGPVPQETFAPQGVTTARLDDAAWLARSGGYRLLIVVIPSHKGVQGEALARVCGPAWADAIEEEARRLEAACRYAQRQGILCFDAAPGLRAALADGQPLYLKGGLHWSPQGHAEFARLLADYLRASGLLDD